MKHSIQTLNLRVVSNYLHGSGFFSMMTRRTHHRKTVLAKIEEKEEQKKMRCKQMIFIPAHQIYTNPW